MELNRFLFGNVDEHGHLEDDDLDEDLKRCLIQFSTRKETLEIVDQLLQPTDQSAGESSKTSGPTAKAAIQPLDHAVDYFDIGEEAEDSQPAEKPKIQSQFQMTDFDDVFELPTPSVDLLPELKVFVELLKNGSSVKFTNLFTSQHAAPESISTTSTAHLQLQTKRLRLRHKEELHLEVDTAETQKLSQRELDAKTRYVPRVSFKQRVQSQLLQPNSAPKGAARLSPSQIAWLRSLSSDRGSECEIQPLREHSDVRFNFEVFPWESKVAVEAPQQSSNGFPQIRPYLVSHNWDLERGKWQESILTDAQIAPKVCPILHTILSMNDPYLTLDRISKDDVAKKLSKTESLIAKRLRRLRRAQQAGFDTTQATTTAASATPGSRDFCSLPHSTKALETPGTLFSRAFPGERYNLSNDRYYDSLSSSERKSTQQNAFEKVSLHHSIPALQLQAPHFPGFLSPSQLRRFHRPHLSITVGEQISFQPLRPDKQSKKTQSDFAEVVKSNKGITARDTSTVCIFEYSEEQPLLICNGGMASLLNIYYRKTNARDMFVPSQLEDGFGIPTVLEVNEIGPFRGFVEVLAGKTLLVLFNNLFRAPIVEQPGTTDDFLAIRYTREGATSSTWYLRPNVRLFLVGQALPIVDVYGPHSRKLNVFSRNRIQVAAYRHFQLVDNPRKRLKISHLIGSFSQFSEGTIRKWLKEYADSARQGNDVGYWVMRPSAPTLVEDELQQLVTPEMVCQYESMLYGQQRLIDTGHSVATAMLGANPDLLDDDDQDQLVDDELKLTPWNLTNNFLYACQGKAMLTLNGIGDPSGCGCAFSFLKVPLKTQIAYRQAFECNGRASTAAASPFYNRPTQTEQHAAYRREISAIWDRMLKSISSDFKNTLSAQQSSSLEVKATIVPRSFRGKQLSITRTVFGANGVPQEEVQIVDDGRVIAGYLEAKQKAAKLLQIQQQDAQPNRKASTTAAFSEKVLKCGVCGQVGHMRTNKSCPLYREESSRNTAEQRVLQRETADGKVITLKLPTDPSCKPAPIKRRKQSSIRESDAKRKKKTPRLNKSLGSIVQQVQQQIPESAPFHLPVDESFAPNYLTIIASPISMQCIFEKCTRGLYANCDEFLRDFDLMLSNCQQYNGPSNYLCHIASVIRERAGRMCQRLKPKTQTPKLVLRLGKSAVPPAAPAQSAIIDILQ